MLPRDMGAAFLTSSTHIGDGHERELTGSGLLLTLISNRLVRVKIPGWYVNHLCATLWIKLIAADAEKSLQRGLYKATRGSGDSE